MVLNNNIKKLNRITFDPQVLGGKPCIRGLRITAGAIVGLIASGKSREEILELYPYLEAEDIDQALSYAAWKPSEVIPELDIPSLRGSLSDVKENFTRDERDRS